MHKLIIACSLPLAAALTLAACATAPGLGEEAGGTTLPAGLALLESEQETCEGTVQIGQDSVETDGLEELFVEPGQNAAYRLQDDEIEWICTVDASPDVEELDCPDDASHVRITRDGNGRDLLFECFG